MTDTSDLVRTKVCTKCGKEKPTPDFYRHAPGRYGVRGDCKQCCNNAQKRRLADPERRKARKTYITQWNRRNRDKIRQYQKRYYDANAETINKKLVDYFRQNPERRREVVTKSAEKARLTGRRKLEDAISAGVSRGIKKGSKAGRRTFELLGYSPKELRSHLEKQFQPGMTWENYGKGGWHIDHKIPRSAFNYETPDDIDFGRCWALTNLQPLWEVDNLKKSNKFSGGFQPSLRLAAPANDNKKSNTHHKQEK